MTRAIPVAIVLGLLLAWTPKARQQGQIAAAGMTRPVMEAWNRFSLFLGSFLPGHKSAAAEARELAAKLREAEAALAECDAVRRENNQLRLALRLPERPGWQAVVGEVIARDPVTWNRGFRIGRGSEDGVLVGSAVLVGRYVLGRVSEVGKASSLVETVGTPGCKLSVVLTGSGSVGMLWGRAREQWRGPPECTVNYLPKDISVDQSEPVVTSGMGGMVPDGLVVGSVSGPVKVLEGTHASVRILPAASFRRVNFVTVLCPTEPPATP